MDIEAMAKAVIPSLMATAIQAGAAEAERQGYRIIPPGSVSIPRSRPEAMLMKLVAETYLADHPEQPPAPPSSPTPETAATNQNVDQDAQTAA